LPVAATSRPQNHAVSIPCAGIAGRHPPGAERHLHGTASSANNPHDGSSGATSRIDFHGGAIAGGGRRKRRKCRCRFPGTPDPARRDAGRLLCAQLVARRVRCRTHNDSVLTDVAVWGPNEAKLRAGDLVEVLDEQSTLFALLYLVEHVPAKFIRFAELIKAPLGGLAVGQVEARGHHYAQWRGPAKRWCIIGPTGTMVRDGILTKEEAERDVTTRNMPTSMAFVSHPRM
jgi:hypothetical protein